MTALIQERSRRAENWKYRQFTLASGTKAYKGGRAALNTAGQVVPATSTTGLIAIGVFAETIDAAAAAALVNVDLEVEITLEWFANATAGDACAATDIGSDCFMFDDQTVSITGIGRSVAGKIYGVDALKGVLVRRADVSRSVLSTPAQAAFVAGDWAPATLERDAIYLSPPNAALAASTVTLPAAAPDGIRVSFVADGAGNLGTIQYRDATGLVNLTTALVAAKRHLVIAEKRGGLWFANAYASP